MIRENRPAPIGVWRSLVARFVRDEEVVGSNPATPTQSQGPLLLEGVLCFLERFDRSDQGFSWRFSFAQMIGSSFLTNVIVR
ncbi:MAG: hypothetical protein QOD27_1804 [Microbacteriaceae bacterium]|nr:hypothetical protein [Microbacteriaceae bacterium]MCU1581035.1 hypothetical protein [Microbacteriaceae bacterium]MDQ1550146.1 hypothetical protein [Microbacteriaceae bacterium]MDQ1578855.1 hypothetical protein [Microbacteriaceae bacterium]